MTTIQRHFHKELVNVEEEELIALDRAKDYPSALLKN